MPAVSVSQRKLMGWAYACKTGKSDNCPPNILKIANSMSKEELEKFASTEEDDLPKNIVVESVSSESYSLLYGWEVLGESETWQAYDWNNSYIADNVVEHVSKMLGCKPKDLLEFGWMNFPLQAKDRNIKKMIDLVPDTIHEFEVEDDMNGSTYKITQFEFNDFPLGKIVSVVDEDADVTCYFISRHVFKNRQIPKSIASIPVFESDINERKTIRVKRKYTENHPEVRIGQIAPVRNRVLEYIGNRGTVSYRQLKNFISKVQESEGISISMRWIKKNSALIDSEIVEGYVKFSLTKRGKRIFERIRKSKKSVPNSGKINE